MANKPSIHIPYPYQPLQQTNHFRLLRLLPGSKSQDVECSLVNTSPDSMPEYDALSYSWGSSKDPHFTIWIDRIPVPVRENLYYALLALRRSSQAQVRVLWVDAICINQRDDAERSSQIQQMDMIYGQAEQ